MMLQRIPLDNIDCSTSVRKELGDRDGSLELLMQSIAHTGLLEPLTVTSHYVLISGRRRLEACRRLHYDEVPAYVIDISALLIGQADANVLHKQFTLIERVRLALAIREEVGSRQGQRSPADEEGVHTIQSGMLTSEYAAKKAGLGSRKTFERARRVLESGCPALLSALNEGKLSIAAAAELATRSQAEQEHVVSGGRKTLEAFLTSHEATGVDNDLGAVAQRLQSLAKSLRGRSRQDATTLTTVATELSRLGVWLGTLACGSSPVEPELVESLYDPGDRSALLQPRGERVSIPGTDLVLARWAGEERNRDLIPTRDPYYLFQVMVVEELQQAINTRQNAILIGPPGDGKTTLIEQVAAVVEAPLMVVCGHADLRTHQLLGMDILENSAMVFKKGPLAIAFEKGYWFLFDEITAVSPGVLHAIHGVLNGDETLRLDGERVIRRAPGFRFFATTNTAGAAASRLQRAAGNRRPSDATLSRFPVKITLPALTRDAVMELLTRWSPSDGAGLPDDAAARLADWFLEVRQSALGAYSVVQYPITLRELRALWITWQTTVETTSEPRQRSLVSAVRSTLLNALEQHEEQRHVLNLLSTYFDLDDSEELHELLGALALGTT